MMVTDRVAYTVTTTSGAAEYTTTLFGDLPGTETVIVLRPDQTNPPSLDAEAAPPYSDLPDSDILVADSKPAVAALESEVTVGSTASLPSQSVSYIVIQANIPIPATPISVASTALPTFEVVKGIQLAIGPAATVQAETTLTHTLAFPAYTLPAGPGKGTVQKTLDIKIPPSQAGQRATQILEITQEIIVPPNMVEHVSEFGLDFELTKLISALPAASESTEGGSSTSFKVIEKVELPADAAPDKAPNGLIIKITERITIPPGFIRGPKTDGSVIEITESI
ncbi:hypothetical protein K4F52_009873 [Lecanicillium sp. MT-2017a]|nr:hypothetical protein K4F52_009873 [Lecanicillium sp. MT-2017a]